jgi:DNA-binding GntR family transcriptional regulator
MKRVRMVIASPGDVAAERDAVERIANELNRTVGREADKDFHIDVYRWEVDSNAGFHVHGPQGKIDQKFQIPECDIIVVVFWMRFGSNIASGTETGTEHEMNLAFESWMKSRKPEILTYFKTSNIAVDDIDETQLTRLNKFKGEFKPGGRFEQGAYKTFDEIGTFTEILRRDLMDYFANLRPPPPHIFARNNESSEQNSPPRQILVCSTEATFDGHIPLREIDCVISCLEDALKNGLTLVKRGAGTPLRTNEPLSVSFSAKLASVSEPAAVSPHGAAVNLIWELPQGREGKKVEIGLVLLVLDFVNFLQQRFRRNLGDMTRSFRPYSRRVNLRVALSTGKALRRFSGLDGGVDYIGPPIEEVAELRRAIAPGGLIANMRLAPYVFMERLCAKEGQPDCKVVGSQGEQCPVWITHKPLRRRRPKHKPLDSLDAVLDWAKRPYLENGEAAYAQQALTDDDHASLPPLTEDDLTSVFDIRESWESRFASELSSRARPEQETGVSLKVIEDTIDNMQALYLSRPNVTDDPEWRHYGARFHSQIAELSHPVENARRRHFTEWAYEFTDAVYAYGMIDPNNPAETEGNVVIKEHLHIIELIKNGEAKAVGDKIRDHLVQHYDRALDALLRCSSHIR